MKETAELSDELEITPSIATMPLNPGSLTFKVKGGTPSYSWSASVGSLQVSLDGKTATLTPPTNNGGFPGVIAYARYAKVGGCLDASGGGCTGTSPLCQGGAPGICCKLTNETCSGHGCDDSPIPCTPTFGFCGGITDGSKCLVVADSNDALASGCADTFGWTKYPGGKNTFLSNTYGGTYEDRRTQQMINAGCNPCGLAFKNGVVVTVTDSLGKSVAAAVTLS